jgi:hypothetical protein
MSEPTKDGREDGPHSPQAGRSASPAVSATPEAPSMTDLRACDIPGAVVGMAFAEAVADLAVLRVRHVEAYGCGGACSVDVLLTWAATVFEHWAEPQIGYDDLAAAILVLRTVG